ncbi:MAG: DNA adenine methylase [Spirochaetales bacterium]|nr:DNA adenine methylase [Spirochaetales bacterium]
MDFNNPFLTKQIIAYIGNKRKLLDLIYKAMQQSLGELSPGLKFFDVFAGSGIVSRLGKFLEFEVYSNDWEHYSYIINNGFIKTNETDIIELFGSRGKFNTLLEKINDLPNPKENEQYISKYYAPQTFDIDAVDFRKERLFYTRENALAIDKIRNYIEEKFKFGKDNRIRYLLISLLLYEAATHTNTSGVFKAFHKGFGGHNKDALKRILTPVRLKMPCLWDSRFPVHIFSEDANTLVKKNEVQNIDIAYLDPPYNQHQYGSNYHMLNTIARWDKIPALLTLNEKGVLKEKAAIRKDWVSTKSDYCYQDLAVSSFTDLIKNLSARYILLSYSTDGIIPFEVMKDICRKKGKISIVTNEYTKYRGGKQSNSRLNTNIEFILTINTHEKSTKTAIKNVDAVVNKKKILLMFKQKYSLKKMKSHCVSIRGTEITFDTGKQKLTFPSNACFELFPIDEINKLTTEETEILFNLLSHCVCRTKEEELEEIVSKIDGNTEENLYFIKLIPDTLKKLAHKKNKKRFYLWIDKVRKIEQKHMELYSLIKEKINKIEELAEKRFNN